MVISNIKTIATFDEYDYINIYPKKVGYFYKNIGNRNLVKIKKSMGVAYNYKSNGKSLYFPTVKDNKMLALYFSAPMKYSYSESRGSILGKLIDKACGALCRNAIIQIQEGRVPILKCWIFFNKNMTMDSLKGVLQILNTRISFIPRKQFYKTTAPIPLLSITSFTRMYTFNHPEALLSTVPWFS